MRRRGVVVRALASGAEGRGIEITFDQVSETLHPAANGYPTLFRAGEGLDGEGRGDGHAALIDTSGTLTFTAPTANQLWDLPLLMQYL